MKVNSRIIFFAIIFLFFVSGCSEGAPDTGDSPSILNLETDIVGSWAPAGSNTGERWQFFEDGRFIDTENAAYEYRIQKIDGVEYLAFDREGLGIKLTEADQEEIERAFGGSDFIPIYEAHLTSKDSLILDPATILYGSESYFNYSFVTMILQRQ